MFCPSCGAENASDARFCGGCGASINVINTGVDVPTSDQGMSFGKAISTCLSKYGVWQGRASRSEYWWFFLFLTLLGWAVNIVDAVAMDGNKVGPAIFNLAFLSPSIAAMIRRLHDKNRSGWWSLIVFTGIGIPVLIYWLASRGDEGQNNYG